MNLNDHNLSGAGGFIIENTFGPDTTGGRSYLAKPLGNQWIEEPGNLYTVNSSFSTSRTFLDGVFFNGNWVCIIADVGRTAAGWQGVTPSTNSVIATSPNFIDWTQRTIAGSSAIPYSLAINPTTGKLNLFLASNRVQESSDGFTWTEVTRSGSVNGLICKTPYQGNLLSIGATSLPTYLFLYDTTTNNQTSYSVSGVTGNARASVFATNGQSVIIIFRASGNNAIIRRTTDLSNWTTPKLFVNGEQIPDSLNGSYDIVWTGTHYILMALSPILTNIQTNNYLFNYLPFFRSENGEEFHYCGNCDIQNNIINNRTDQVNVFGKNSISFYLSNSLYLMLSNRNAIAINGVVYFNMCVGVPVYMGDYTKSFNVIVRSKDNGSSWDIVYTSFVENQYPVGMSCMFGNPATGEICASPVPFTTNSSRQRPIKSIPNAKELRRIY